jgi:hypothetical protein
MAQDLSRLSTEELMALRQRQLQQAQQAQQPQQPRQAQPLPTTTIPRPVSRQINDANNLSQINLRDVQAPNVQANTVETGVDIAKKTFDYENAIRGRARGGLARDKSTRQLQDQLMATGRAEQLVRDGALGTFSSLLGNAEGPGVRATGLGSLPVVGPFLTSGTDRSDLIPILNTLSAGNSVEGFNMIKQIGAESGNPAIGGNTSEMEFAAFGRTNADLTPDTFLQLSPDAALRQLDTVREALLERYAVESLIAGGFESLDPADRQKALQMSLDQARREFARGFQPISEEEDAAGVLNDPGGRGGPPLGGITPRRGDGPGTRIRSDGSPEAGVATSDTRTIQNPEMQGTNAQVRQMVREGAKTGDIVEYMKSRGVPVTKDLVATVQSNVEFYRNYRGRALPATVPEPVVNLESMIEPVTTRERVSGLLFDTVPGTVATQFADGVFLGGLDEVASGGDPERMAELDFAKRYQRENSPYISGASRIAGGLGTFIPAARVASGAARLANLGTRGTTAVQAATNTALGGLEGALDANEDRKTGAIIGAGFGLAGDVGGRYIGGKLAGRFADEPGAAERAVANAVTDAGQVRGVLTEAERLGSPAALADTSPALRNLAGASVRRSDEAGVLADNVVGGRDLAQVDRAIGTVERTLARETNVPRAARDMRRQGQAAAGPDYEAAYGRVGIAADPEIKAILARPDVAEGLQEAQRTLANRGRDWKELGFSVNDKGRVTLGENATFEALDLAKRGIDTVLRKPEYRDAFGRLNLRDDATRAVVDAQQALVARMRTLNPDYARALDTYAPFGANAEALEMGGKAITATKVTPAEIGEVVAGMDDAARANYQIGAANAIIDRIKKAKDNTDAFAVFRSEDMRQRLTAVFPDRATELADLRSVTQLEGLMRRTKEALLGGSATAGRQAADEAFGATASALGPLAEGGMSLATGGVSTVLQSVVRLAGMSGRDARRLANVRDQEALARDLAPILMETDPKKARAALDGILKKVDTYDRTRTTSRRRGGAAGAAAVASGGVLAE